MDYYVKDHLTLNEGFRIAPPQLIRLFHGYRHAPDDICASLLELFASVLRQLGVFSCNFTS